MPRSLTHNGRHQFWWSQLCAVPNDLTSLAYDRLKRVWFDQTGCREGFADPRREVHLVCTLFENMAILDPASWLPDLFHAAGIGDVPTGVSHCQWSYEFEHGESKRIADVVGCFTDAAGDAIFVIEAKRAKGTLKAGDTDPDYYVGLNVFARYARRFMLYLVDEGDLAACQAPVEHDRAHRGILTWQQLAELQIRQARSLPIPPAYRDYIAASIQYQFCEHDIRPSRLAFSYLEREPAYDEMPRSERDGGQSTQERREPLWQH